MKRSISSFFASNKKICSNECESQSIGGQVEVENSMADFELGVDVQIDIDDQMFLPTLDRIVEELRRGFVENNSILDGVNCLHPESRIFLEITKLKVMAAHYGCDTESLEVEIKLIPKVIKRFEDENGIQIKTLSDFAHFLEKYRIAFHELYQLAVIAITILVSSATCERTFSCLRRLKTYLHNSMSNERMSVPATEATVPLEYLC